MGNKKLYTLDIAEDDLTKGSDRQQRKLQTQGSLGQGPASVNSVTTQPGEFFLTGRIRGTQDNLERIMAAEIEGLFDAPDIGSVAYYDVAQETERDGYYALENVRTTPTDPRTGGETEFDGRLKRKGTPKSHYRFIETTTSPVTNDFGNGGTPLIGVPAAATRVRWLDRKTKATESASPSSTRAGQFGDVDLFDLADTTFSNDVGLVYQLALDREGDVDPKVWDERNRSRTATPFARPAKLDTATLGGATLESSGAIVANRWRRVFRPAHRFVGATVVENGHLRLVFDEADAELDAYRWNDTLHRWEPVALGNTTWRFDEIDLRRIADDRVEALTRWQDIRGTGTATLRLSLMRGQTDGLWTRPATGSQAPSGLVTRLDPVAADWTTDPSPSKTLLDRTVVDY